MKIVLTHAYFLNEDEREKQVMRPYVPLGILYISACLEKFGFDNDVFDTTFSTFEEQKIFITAQSPDIVGIYTNLMTKLNVLRLIKFIKSNPALVHTKVVLGGPE